MIKVSSSRIYHGCSAVYRYALQGVRVLVDRRVGKGAFRHSVSFAGFNRNTYVVDFKSIDDRTNLAGTNRLELLMFRLRSPVEGQNTPMYAISVFKVREIMVLPRLIDVPECHHYIAGVANTRGKAIPVIDLIRYCGYHNQGKGNILIVTEFNSKTQGFMVQEVDNIIQLAWSEIHEPPDVIRDDNNNALTAMSQIEEDHMLLILDVEKIIAEALGSKIDLDGHPA